MKLHENMIVLSFQYFSVFKLINNFVHVIKKHNRLSTRSTQSGLRVQLGTIST